MSLVLPVWILPKRRQSGYSSTSSSAEVSVRFLSALLIVLAIPVFGQQTGLQQTQPWFGPEAILRSDTRLDSIFVRRELKPSVTTRPRCHPAKVVARACLSQHPGSKEKGGLENRDRPARILWPGL